MRHRLFDVKACYTIELVLKNVFVLGDIGGYVDIWHQALNAMGVDPDTGTMPDETTVIQLGDLGRLNRIGGRGDRRILIEADRILRKNPRRWIQILGNHDLAYAGGPYIESWAPKNEMDPISANIVRGWLDERIVQLAAGLMTPDGPCVVSHAGLTLPNWQGLDTRDWRSIVRALNNRVNPQLPNNTVTGLVYDGGRANTKADTLWASLVEELYEPWLAYGQTEPLPFNQIHGHSSFWNYNANCFMDDVPEQWRQKITMDFTNRRSVMTIGLGEWDAPARFWGLDWRCEQGPLGYLPEVFQIPTTDTCI